MKICNAVRSIKYVMKYMHKGSDQAVFSVEGNTIEARFDEVKMFQTGCYIFTSEALWRIFEFPVHDHHLAVTHLDIHVENGQRVFLNEATNSSGESSGSAQDKIVGILQAANVMTLPRISCTLKCQGTTPGSRARRSSREGR